MQWPRKYAMPVILGLHIGESFLLHAENNRSLQS